MDKPEHKRRKKKRDRSPRQTRQRLRREDGSLPYSRARLNFLRMAPRKVRMVADQIRGQNVEKAIQALIFSHRSAAEPVLRLLNSAIANAENEGLDSDSLRISEIWVDGGPILKRFMPRAMGRASRINKRTSHVTLILKEEE